MWFFLFVLFFVLFLFCIFSFLFPFFDSSFFAFPCFTSLFYFSCQECVNDTYLRTWNSIPPTRPQFFFAYLAKICRFLCFDVLDHKNAQKRSALVVELTHEMQQCIPDSRNEDKVQGEQIGQNITAFLRIQSKQDRLLFMKRYWYGVSIKDLAQQMQISESSAKVRLHRIRGRLKKYLESEGIWI